VRRDEVVNRRNNCPLKTIAILDTDAVRKYIPQDVFLKFGL
jgi:hypothetical protein